MMLVVHRGERCPTASRRAPDRARAGARAPRGQVEVAHVGAMLLRSRVLERSSQLRQPGRHGPQLVRPSVGTIGMLLPGLIVCGSAIQAASDPRVVGSSPAAMVRRLATWVRSGPSVPAAGVPRTVWQAAQALAVKNCAPGLAVPPSRRPRGLRAAPSRHASNAAGVSAITSSAICACCRPQNSAHWPR